MEKLKSEIVRYDELWDKWKDLAKNPLSPSPSIYHKEFKYAENTNKSIEKYWTMLKNYYDEKNNHNSIS